MSNNDNIFLEIIEEEDEDLNGEDLNDEDLDDEDLDDEDLDDEDLDDEELDDEELEELNRLKEITEKLWSEDHLTHTYENIKKNEKIDKKNKRIHVIQSNFSLKKKYNKNLTNKNSIKNNNVKTLQRKPRYRGFMAF